MSIRFRRNTKAAADTSNPVLAAGEPGFATDTGDLRIGDGTSAWSALPDTHRALTVAAGSSTFAAQADLATKAEAADVAAVTTEQEWDAKALTARLARDAAYKVATTDGLAAFTSSSGLAFTSNYYAATVGGTDGTGIFPKWKKVSRAAFRVKVTKATASSKSYVGVCNTIQGVMPTGTTPTFGVGYKAGTGICLVRENVGGDIVLVADSALTDGDLYDIHLIFDRSMYPSSVTGAGTKAQLMVRYAKSDGTGAGIGQAEVNLSFWPNMWNWFVRTNVAAGGITNLTATAPLTGTGASVVGGGGTSYSTVSGEDLYMRVPKNPNGLAIIALHGHGGGYLETGWTSTSYKPTWEALEAAGFTVFVPDAGGDLWGNDTVMSLLATLHGHIVDDFNLDPRVFLWGNSMGGGAALTAIGKDILPVRAAYLAQPVCDLSVLWSNPSFPTLPAAYGNSTTERDDNNPMNMPASAFAGVPMLFTASAADTTVVKTAHTDAFRTKLGTVNDNRLLTVTGNHNDSSHFRPTDTVAWFSANL